MSKYKPRGRGRKNSLPTIGAIILVILLVGIICLFGLIFRPSSESSSGPLNTPENIQVYKTGSDEEGWKYFVSYDEVKGSDKYVIHIDDMFTTSSSATVTDITKFITDAKVYSIGVQAVNNKISSYSSSIVYTEYSNAMQLATPQVTRQNETFLWGSINNATSYTLEVSYGSTVDEYSVTTPNFDLSPILNATKDDPTATKFTVKVKASYSGDLLWLESNYSNSVEYVITKTLANPILTYFTDSVVEEEEVKILHKISWNEVNGADSYEIYLQKLGSSYELIQTLIHPIELEFDLTNYVSEVGNYSVYIKAISDQEYTISSSSSTQQFIITHKLATPMITEAIAEGEYMKVSWVPGDDLNLQTHYYLELYNANTNAIVLGVDVYGTNYSFLLSTIPEGAYRMVVTAKHNTQPNLYIDSEPSTSVDRNIEPKITSPSQIIYVQEKPSSTASLSWNKINNASSYRVYLYQIVGEQEVPFGNVINQTGNTLTLPFTTAGIYYVKVMALATESSFYQDSDYSEATECLFREYLGKTTSISMNDDNTILSWAPVENALTYKVYINDVEIEATIQDTSATNMGEIFSNVELYPSSETVPYRISVRAIGEDGGIYADGEVETIYFYLIRKLDMPTGLSYEQTPNTNEVTLSWLPVENASNGYIVMINGVAPVELQNITETTCSIGSYLLPGTNNILVGANQCTNYAASNYASFETNPTFTYYMQPLSNFSITADVVEGSVTYYASFTTHKYANFYLFNFYASTGDVYTGQSAQRIYSTSNEIVTFVVDYEWIKRYDDCITTVEILTAYDENLQGSTESNFNPAYIIGDGKNTSYSHSVTTYYTYTNESVLVMIDGNSVEIEETSMTSRKISWLYPTSYIENTSMFYITITKIDAVNGNSSSNYVVVASSGVESDIEGYQKFTWLFENLDVGEYTVKLQAISSNPNIANSGSTFANFVLSIQQQKPDGLNIKYDETSGDIVAVWNMIPTHQSFTSYYVQLYVIPKDSSEPILVQQWNSRTSTGLTQNIIQINFSTEISESNKNKTIEENMVSGQYYITVKANAYGDYYLESETAEMTEYFEYDAVVDAPTVLINQENETALIEYQKDTNYMLYYMAPNTEQYVQMSPTNSLQTINDVKYRVYNLSSVFNQSSFSVGIYLISAVAVKVFGETETVSSANSVPVEFKVMKNFDSASFENVELVYEYLNGQDVSTFEASWMQVTVEDGAVNATDYEIDVYSGSSNYLRNIKVQLENNNYVVYLYNAESDTWTKYSHTDISSSLNTKTYNYIVDGNYKFTLSEITEESGIKMLLKVYDLSDFTVGTTYNVIIYTLASEEHYYKQSLTYGYKSFKFMAKWLPPTISFVDSATSSKLPEKYIEANSTTISFDTTANGTSNVKYTFTVYITNLLTGIASEFTTSGSTMANVGTVFVIDESMLSDAGLYRIEAKIVNTTKVESRCSSPIYIYNALNMESPVLTRVTKAETQSSTPSPLGDGSYEKDINLNWTFNGYQFVADLDSETYADFISGLGFILNIVEIDENGNIVQNGLSAQITISSSMFETTDWQNFNFTVLLDNYPALSNYFWSKQWADGESKTHYAFTLQAISYPTYITGIVQNEVSNGYIDAIENYIPHIQPGVFEILGDDYLYYFNKNSDIYTLIVRRDNVLSLTSNITLENNGDIVTITWDVVTDPTGTTEVGYKFVYYTIGYDNTYILYYSKDGSTNENSIVSQQVYYYNNNFYTDQNHTTVITFDNTGVFMGENTWFDAQDLNGFSIVNQTQPLVYGVWVYCYPMAGESASIAASGVYYQTVVRTVQFNMPTSISWSVFTDDTGTQHELSFANNIQQQINNANINNYTSLYTLTLGGFVIGTNDWSNKTPSLNNGNFVAYITELYNANSFVEYQDENGITHSRLYDWQLNAKDYSLSVYDPNVEGGIATHILYSSNTSSGQCYRSIVIERNVPANDTTTFIIENGSYYAQWNEISDATIYEMQFVTANGQPIGNNLSYFTNGEIPSDYVEKITVYIDYDRQYASWQMAGRTYEQEVQYISGSGNKIIKVDFTPLLNGRVAGPYYLAIYTVADPAKFITTNGNATTSSLQFTYNKAYSPVENIEFGFDNEGIVQTISWDGALDADGSWVHEYAYFELQVWKTVGEGENPLLISLSGNNDKSLNCIFENVEGIQSVSNRLTSITYDEDTNRITVNIGSVFRQYLVENGIRIGGDYTVGIVVIPASSSKSSFKESTQATASFAHKVKLEFDQSVSYTSFLIDDCLDESASQNNREPSYIEDSVNTANIYLSNPDVNGNFNIKSINILQWLPAVQSTSIKVYVKNSAGEWVETLQFDNINIQTNNLVLLSGGTVQLQSGKNELAIQAVGINNYYVASELKTFTVNVYYKHATPTLSFDINSDIVYTNASETFSGTVSSLTLHLDDTWAEKEYGVVIYAYKVVDGVYEPYLAWQTSDANGDDENNRLIWKVLNGTACFVYPDTYKDVSKRGKVVNFMDFFYENANQTSGTNKMVSLVGAYDYVFRAKIFAKKSDSSEQYMLNSEFSNITNIFNYTYQMETPTPYVFDYEGTKEIHENVIRDGNNSATAVYVKWPIDQTNFKSVIQYTITVWDGQDKIDEPFERGNGNPNNAGNTVEYSAYIQIYYNENGVAEYSLYAVTMKTYKGSATTISESQYGRYFQIQDGYVVFNMMPFIESTQRVDQYISGVYRYHIQAVQGSTMIGTSTSVGLRVNNYMNISQFAGEYFSGTDVENSNFDYYYEYQHKVPYPVTFTNAVVDNSGNLAITLQDTYATAETIVVTVNGKQTIYSIETPTSSSTTYYVNISTLLLPGDANSVSIYIGAVEFYMQGNPYEVTLGFDEWSTELTTLRDLQWTYNAGSHEISWNVNFNSNYTEDPRLDSGDGVLDADLLHYKLEVLYSPNLISNTEDLPANSMFDYFATQLGVEKLTIENLQNVEGQTIIKFSPQTRNYMFNLIDCVKLIDNSWLEENALRGGWYMLRLTLTAKDTNGISPSGTENYLDAVSYITPMIKQVLAPWKMSTSGDFWAAQSDYVFKDTDNPTLSQKANWADNRDVNWGIKFTVQPVSGNYPTTYRVFYWRDGSTTPFENYFEVTGENVTLNGGYVYLNLRSGFASVVQAGVYNFAWQALGVSDCAEDSEYSYILSATAYQSMDVPLSLSAYGGFGLANYVRVSVPTLSETLSNQTQRSCMITWTYINNTGESSIDLSFSASLMNFVGNDLQDGQTYPTGINGYGPVTATNERNYSYFKNGDTTLNMIEGDNYISIKAVVSGRNGYYLDSSWSTLKKYTWEVVLSAPEIDIYGTSLTAYDENQAYTYRTIPENEESITTDTVNAVDTVDRGGRRETEDYQSTYTNMLTMSVKVSKESVLDNITLLEIMSFDPVTNSLFSQNNALCHYLVKGDLTTGLCYLYQKKNIQYTNNAINSEEWVDADGREIGTCSLNADESVTFMINGFKIYELLPTVTYVNVKVKTETGEETTFTGTKDFANIPQTYRFIMRSYSELTSSEDSGFNYNHTLRLIAPEVTEVNFTGSSIEVLDGQKFINNDLQQSYEIVLNIDKVSRNAKWLMLYAYVDQENGNNYYNVDTGYNAEYSMTNYDDLRSNCLIYDIRGLVNFENSKSTYGTITLTILKDSSLWEFINANTPNVFYFAAQAVSELGYAEDPTVWEGDWYDDYTLDKVQLSQMQLRYCESYIGQPMNCIIYRQFEEAQINLKLDYGQVSTNEQPTALTDSNVKQTVKYNNSDLSTNLAIDNLALDPYLIVEENDYANALLSHEYVEAQKYAGYEITVGLPSGLEKSKTVYSMMNEEGAQGSGLMDATTLFDQLNSTNPARYYFEGNNYVCVTMLEDPCIYDLLFSLFAENKTEATMTGGVCYIKIRIIRETRTTVSKSKNFWVSQDNSDLDTLDFVFYLRPDAVKLTLGNAVFDASNPLVVDWETTNNENELLYPNNIPLQWTESSKFMSTYKISILRTTATQGMGINFVYNFDQGAAAYGKTSVNLAAPSTGWGGNKSIYGELTASTRFNNWDEDQVHQSRQQATVYEIFIETNAIVDSTVTASSKCIGKSYLSGAADGYLNTENVTYYNLQLKYNVYNDIVLKSSGTESSTVDLTGERATMGSVNNGYSVSFNTRTNGNAGASISLNYAGTFDYMAYTTVEATGPFTYKNNGGSFVAVQATKNKTVEGFSALILRDAINNLIGENGGAGGVYTISYHISYTQSGTWNETTPYLSSEESRTFTYEYFRLVDNAQMTVMQSGDGVNFRSSYQATANSFSYTFYGHYSIDMYQVNANTNSKVQTRTYIGGFDPYSVVGGNGTSGSNSYYYKAFDDTKCDALSDRAISNASSFTSNCYTYFPGYIQGGKNQFIYTITAGDTKYNLKYQGLVTLDEYMILSSYAQMVQAEYGSTHTATLEDYHTEYSAEEYLVDFDGLSHAYVVTNNKVSANLSELISTVTMMYANAFSYSYSLSYSSYATSTQSDYSGEYQVITKNTSSKSDSGKTTYSKTKSGVTETIALGDNCYKVTGATFSVSCKSGFASVIEEGGTSTITLTDKLVSISAGASETQTILETRVSIVPSPLVYGSGVAQESFTAKADIEITKNALAYYRSDFSLVVNYSESGSTTHYWTHRHENKVTGLFGSEWRWYTNSESSPGGSFSCNEVITLDAKQKEQKVTKSVTTLEETKKRPNDVNKFWTKELYYDEYVEYTRNYTFSAQLNATNKSNPEGGATYIPAHHSASGLAGFLN